MKIRAHILPADQLSKGSWNLDIAGRTDELVASLNRWILENGPETIPLLLGSHDSENRPAVGYLESAHADEDGVWLVSSITDPAAGAEVLSKRIRRVSARLASDAVDYRNREWPLVVRHVALVHEPQFHDQRPVQVVDLTVTDPASSFIAEGDLVVIPQNGESKMDQNAQTQTHADLDAGTPPEPPAEDMAADKDKDLSSDLTTALATLAELITELRALMPPAPANEDPEDPEEPVDLSARVQELEARNQVLRDVQGKLVAGWTEEELVDLCAKTPDAYRKIVSGFQAPSRREEPPTQASKALGVDLSAAPARAKDPEQAFRDAEKAFERGGKFLETFASLVGEAPAPQS